MAPPSTGIIATGAAMVSALVAHVVTVAWKMGRMKEYMESCTDVLEKRVEFTEKRLDKFNGMPIQVARIEERLDMIWEKINE